MSNEQKNAITVTFFGTNAAEVRKQMAEFCPSGDSSLVQVETEALLKELRDRFAKQGQVVKVVPFANDETAESTVETTSTPPATKRGRPRKVAEDATKPFEGTTAAAPEPEKIVEPAPQPVASIEDVKKSLNEFAAVHGQVEARRIMSEVGGSPALKDVPAEKYAAVIEGLSNFKMAA
jgi:hypothetical protein